MIPGDDRQPATAAPLPRVFVHDLMNQLCTILGHADLLLDALPPDSPMTGDVRAVRDACRKAIELTDRSSEGPRSA
jgi:hypothetical protein